MSFLIGWRLSQGHFLAYRNILHQTHDLSSLAPGVTRSTQLLQPTLGSRQVCCLRQGALAGRFSGAIDVEDDPTDSTAIHQSPGLPLLRQRAAEQVIEEEAAQGFNWRW